MAALQDRRARLLNSLYATYGEPADWTPAGGGAATRVTIRRRPEDVEVQSGQGFTLMRKDFIKVRRSEMASAARGDLVTVLDADTLAPVASYKIIADPRLEKAATEWVCEPGEVRS